MWNLFICCRNLKSFWFREWGPSQTGVSKVRKVGWLNRKKLEKALRDCKPRPGHHLEFQSNDHLIRNVLFPIGGTLVVSFCLKRFLNICIQVYLGHNLDLFGSHDCIRHMTPCAISYRCSDVTESVSPAVFEIMAPNHSDRCMPFPVGSPLEPDLCLPPFLKYSAQNC